MFIQEKQINLSKKREFYDVLTCLILISFSPTHGSCENLALSPWRGVEQIRSHKKRPHSQELLLSDLCDSYLGTPTYRACLYLT